MVPRQWRRNVVHAANGSPQPFAAGQFSVNSSRDAGGDARHDGAAGDGSAPTTPQPLSEPVN